MTASWTISSRMRKNNPAEEPRVQTTESTNVLAHRAGILAGSNTSLLAETPGVSRVFPISGSTGFFVSPRSAQQW